VRAEEGCREREDGSDVERERMDLRIRLLSVYLASSSKCRHCIFSERRSTKEQGAICEDDLSRIRLGKMKALVQG